MATIPELEELPTLTPKQTAFVNGLLQGKTASDAYRAAYDCKNMSKEAIWVAASRLRANTKVALWLRYVQRIGIDAALVTMEGHLAELARGREMALAMGQASAAIQAEHYRGKAAGLYEDRLRLEVGPSDAELLQVIEDLLGKEAVEAIGAALGSLSERER